MGPTPQAAAVPPRWTRMQRVPSRTPLPPIVTTNRTRGAARKGKCDPGKACRVCRGGGLEREALQKVARQAAWERQPRERHTRANTAKDKDRRRRGNRSRRNPGYPERGAEEERPAGIASTQQNKPHPAATQSGINPPST
jgi:hypothetical protein